MDDKLEYHREYPHPIAVTHGGKNPKCGSIFLVRRSRERGDHDIMVSSKTNIAIDKKYAVCLVIRQSSDRAIDKSSNEFASSIRKL